MLAQLIFAASVVVAGTVGWLCLVMPARGAALVFSNTAQDRSALAVVGAFWLAIAALSVAGVFRPQEFQPVLLVQLVYKELWLVAFALPALVTDRGHSVPWGIATFFAVWVLILPLAIDWSALFGTNSG